jgi:hypothetical protein
MHVPGFFTIRNECNMDPMSYSLTILDSTARLGRDHNLSLPELHSVQMAYHVLPHTCMFFGVSSRMLLEADTNQIPASYRKGYGFGFLLASVMVELFMHTRESGIQQDYRRFSCYREPLVPTRYRWEEMCHETTVYCLHVFAAYRQPSSKKGRTEQYKKIASTISDIWDGTGTLGVNHLINHKAFLGFLPAWCREAATVEPSSLVVKFFNEKYKLRRKLNRTELDRFLLSLPRQLEVVFKTRFTERIYARHSKLSVSRMQRRGHHGVIPYFQDSCFTNSKATLFRLFLQAVKQNNWNGVQL